MSAYGYASAAPPRVLPPLAHVEKSTDWRAANELSDTDLARLCSNHVMSEYNTMRRKSGGPVVAPRPTFFTPPPAQRTAVAHPSRPPMTTLPNDATLYDSPLRRPPHWPDADTPIEADFDVSPPRLYSTVPTPPPSHTSGYFLRSSVPAGAVGFPTVLEPALPPGAKTSLTHPIHLSPMIPPELLDVFGHYILGPPPADDAPPPHMPVFAPSSPTRRSVSAHVIRAGAPLSHVRSSPSLRTPPRPPSPRKAVDGPFRLVQHARHPGHSPLDLLCLTEPVADAWSAPFATTTRLLWSSVEPPPTYGGAGPLGQLFLSSCPGKKVRMTPEERAGARGRPTICRDLGLDLEVVANAGVRCIICCLDNDELALLGAPWPEYAAAADALGLEVVRLPMAEGDGPPSVNCLDAVLEAALQYTLRGAHVLVHCRGGVGRAGLVACAWLLKLGLVSLDLARVIALVRRRRSVKCIETATQVRAVLDYVAFLRHEARPVSADDVLRSPRFAEP